MIPDNDGQVDPGHEANDIDFDTDFTAPEMNGGRKLLVIPENPDQFPVVNLDLIAEAAAMMKVAEHYAKVKPTLEALASGIYINGGQDWDHKKMVFDFQADAKNNGYMGLAQANAAQIGAAFSWAFRRVTKMSLADVRKQGKQLHLEHQRQLKDMRDAAE